MTKFSHKGRAQVVYTAPGMEHIDRRQIERLAAAVDREINADRNFFKRRPDRSFRVRQAFPAERRAAELAGTCRIEAGRQAYVVVRQIQPGRRLRAFFLDRPGLDTDVPEEVAASIYARLINSSEKASQLEGKLSQILGEP